jgi:uncharacterized protein
MTHPGRPWRVVIDPSVYVAALIAPGGVCGDLVGAVNEDRLTAVACPLLLAELHEVLLRPKFRRWTTIDGVLAFGRAIAARCEIETDPEDPSSHTRDVKDDYLVALAIQTGADAIVSGDQDLVAATVPISVWQPREALARLTL